MIRHRRHHGWTVLVLLFGVLLIAAGSTLPWGEFALGGTDQPPVPYGGSHVFGFDQTVRFDHSVSNFGPALLIISGVLTLCSLALLLTRIRGLGIAWRVIALGSLVPLAPVLDSLWSIFDESPGTDLEQADSAPVRAFGLAMRGGGVASTVGPGLILISLGFVMVVLGCLIPAARSQQLIRPAGAKPPTYGDFLKPEARVSQ